ncbi:hypothetical protein [Ruminococcus sp. NK3A76]|uniref:hypothetical protein n=1 Tax=Ruminococcus sp. NK3A76 TaxID=877411 RepID=UPI000491D1EA|nr:hypothetical protein [Ruminococcus sp. NK3A76]
MANEKIVMMMLCFGVSINELADQLLITEEDMVEKLCAEMDFVKNFEVMLAIVDIVKRGERA